MFADLPLAVPAGVFAVAAILVVLAGLRLTDIADRLADRTGLGEALVGGVLLGASTSLGGLVVSLTTALEGRAEMAVSNGVGGIAVQTAFLAVADLAYRRSNLEHAGADIANLFQGVILIVLLTIPLLAIAAPEWTLWHIHPASFVLPAVYAAGLVATAKVRSTPMWRPVDTAETRHDTEEDDGTSTSTGRLVVGFLGLMAVLGATGWALAVSAGSLTDRLSLSSSLVGALMTAVVTSLPELVTTLAAVRRNALQLAVGGIIGGNTFDTLMLTVSDVAYTDGSIYHAAGQAGLFWLGVSLLMTAILLMGLVLREREGIGNIGFDGVALLGVYAGAVALQVAIF